MLLRLLQDKYKTLLHHGGASHTAIQQFKQDGGILISTDNGARGFNLEEAAFVIHYDLPYNTLKMEQRIDRCQCLGQENDVLSLAFINQHNLADVRKLELARNEEANRRAVSAAEDVLFTTFTRELAQRLICPHGTSASRQRS